MEIWNISVSVKEDTWENSLKFKLNEQNIKISIFLLDTTVPYPVTPRVKMSCAFPYQCDMLGNPCMWSLWPEAEINTGCNNSRRYSGFSQCGYATSSLFEIHWSGAQRTTRSPLKVQTFQEVKPPVIARQFSKLQMATSAVASLM